MQNKYHDTSKSITRKIDNIIVGLILFLLCALPLTIDLHLVKPFSLCKLVLFYGTALFVITFWLTKLVPLRFKQRLVSISAKNSTSSRNIHRQGAFHSPLINGEQPPKSPTKGKQLHKSPLIKGDSGGCSFFRHTPLTYPVLAYITAVIFSTIFSLNKTISVFGYYVHYEGLLTSIGYAILFYAVVTCFKKRHVFYMTIAISIACFLSSIYGVIQFLNYDPISWANVDERLKITSTFGNPVFFSGYIVSVFPLILVVFLLQLKSLSSGNTPHHDPLPQGEREHSPVIDNHIDTSALAASSDTVTHGLIDSHIPNPPAAGSHKVTSPPSMGGARGGCKPSPSSTGRKLAAVSSKKPFLGKCFLAFLCIVLILMLFNLYITKTRGAWLGFVFSILCVMALLYVEFIVKHRIKFIVSAICFMVIFGVFVGCKYKHPINQLLYLLKQKGDVSVALIDANKGDPIGRSYFINTRGGQSIFYRVIQYKSALDMICDHPLTGIGPDMLSSVLPRYAFNHYKQSPATPEFENVLGIHNDILDKATTCGIIGLGTYLWIFGAFILFIKRHFPRSEKVAVHPHLNLPLSPPPEGDRGRTFSPSMRGTGGGIQGDSEHSPPLVGGGELLRNRLILSGLLACLVGYLVQQQFNVIEYTITLHFWIFLAASIALLNPIEEKDSSARRAIKEQMSQKKPHAETSKRTLTAPLFYLCYLPIMGILVYGLSCLINLYKADVIHKKGSDFLAYATTHQESGIELNKNLYWEKGLEYYKDSILYNPRQAIYRYQLCEAYLFMLRKDLNNIDLINQTIKEAEEIIRLDPNEDFALNYLANAYDLLEYNTKKDYSDKIIPACERAISINPYKLTYYDCLGTYYVKKGFYEKAIPVYKQIFHMKSDYPRIAEKLTNAYKPHIKNLIAQEQLSNAELLLNEIQSMPHLEDNYLRKLKTLIYGKRGQWEDVVRESEQIISAQSDDIDAYQNIATAYYVMKKYDDAKKTLEKILQLSFNNKLANDLLQEINNRKHKDAAHQ